MKYSEWYLNIRLTLEPWGRWKFNFFSPAAALFQRLETKLIPGLLLHLASPAPLWQQSRVTNTLQSTPAPLLALQLCWSIHPMGQKLQGWTGCSSSALWWYWEPPGPGDDFQPSKPPLVLLLQLNSWIKLTPELLPLPCSPWSWPPCSFPPVLSFLSLLFVFRL